MCHAHRGLTTSHNHHIADVGIAFLTHYAAHKGNSLLSCHEICQVIQLQGVVASRYYRLIATLDSHDMIRILRTYQLFQRAIEYLALLTQFDAEHHQGTVMHVPALAHPRHLQSIDNILRRQQFGVNDRVNPHALQHILILWLGILVFLYTSHGMPGSERLCQRT